MTDKKDKGVEWIKLNGKAKAEWAYQAIKQNNEDIIIKLINDKNFLKSRNMFPLHFCVMFSNKLIKLIKLILHLLKVTRIRLQWTTDWRHEFLRRRGA